MRCPIASNPSLSVGLNFDDMMEDRPVLCSRVSKSGRCDWRKIGLSGNPRKAGALIPWGRGGGQMEESPTAISPTENN